LNRPPRVTCSYGSATASASRAVGWGLERDRTPAGSTHGRPHRRALIAIQPPRVGPTGVRLFRGTQPLLSCRVRCWTWFGAPSAPRRRSNFRRQVSQPALVKAGLSGLRFHDLRHPYANWLASDGMPVNVVQRIMHHEQASTTLTLHTHAPSDYDSDSR